MVKINPGKDNIHGDNETRNPPHSMLNVEFPEPKMNQGKFQCPVCDRLFDTKEAYDSHAMAHHQTDPERLEPMEQPTGATTA